MAKQTGFQGLEGNLEDDVEDKNLDSGGDEWKSPDLLSDESFAFSPDVTSGSSHDATPRHSTPRANVNASAASMTSPLTSSSAASPVTSPSTSSSAALLPATRGRKTTTFDGGDEIEEEDEGEEEESRNIDGRKARVDSVPYLSLMEPEPLFAKTQETLWISGEEIIAHIKGFHRSESRDAHHLLSPNLYTIEMAHGPFKWTIRRRWRHFNELHEHLRRHALKMHFVPVGSENFRERRKAFKRQVSERRNESFRGSGRRANWRPPSFPKVPDGALPVEGLQERKNDLQAYLDELLRKEFFHVHPEFLKFFEISRFSFVADLGAKGKEGLVKKKSGGHQVGVGWYRGLKNLCPCLKPGDFSLRWDERYMVLKDSFLMLVRPSDGTVSYVMLMDQDFTVKKGLKETGIKEGLIIQNASRNLLLTCFSQRKMDEWARAIEEMAAEKAANFLTQRNGRGSFAPERESTWSKWYVDGEQYFIDVADAIDRATEEIYITDWWLSPELHLKRPVAKYGDDFRLDVLLQKKAKQGVKVFVLLYKEVEMALGLNSFHSKEALMSRPGEAPLENIHVLRHPDHVPGITASTLFWAHHEKIVIVDQLLAFVGGIDLCYGRWDNNLHRLVDVGKHQTKLLGRPKIGGPGGGGGGGGGAFNLNNNNNPSSATPTTTTATTAALPLVSAVVMNVVGPLAPGLADPSGPTTPYAQPTGLSRVGLNKSVKTRRSEEVEEETLSVKSPVEIIISPDEDEADKVFGAGDVGDVGGVKIGVGGADRVATPTSPMKRATDPPAFLNVIVDKSDNNNDNAERQPQRSKSNAASKRFAFRSQVKAVLNAQRAGSVLKRTEELTTPTTTPAKPTTPTSRRRGLSDFVGRVQRNHGRDKQQQQQQQHQKRKRKQTHTLMVDQNIHITDAGLQRSRSEVDLFNCWARDGTPRWWIGKDYVNFIIKDFTDLKDPFNDFVNRDDVPRMPWHDIASAVWGPAARDVARHFVQRWNFTKLEKAKERTDYPLIVPKSMDAADLSAAPPAVWKEGAFKTRTQVLRSVSHWSAGNKTPEASIQRGWIDAVDAAQHYIYIENQFFVSNDEVHNRIADAIFRRIVRADEANAAAASAAEKKNFRVYIVLPLLPAFEGDVGTDKGRAIQTITHWNYKSICRGENSLIQRLYRLKIDPTKYVSFHGLRCHDVLNGRPVTELIYVHSKMIIVDDRVVIIGSANINDRSMIGERDSEVAVRYEDTEFRSGTMDGRPFKSGLFAGSLRRALFREMLDVAEGEESDLDDPVGERFYRDIWIHHAANNTKIYDEVFNCIPTDRVLTFKQYSELRAKTSLAEERPDEAKDRLKGVRGHLVLFPFYFLNGENLNPPQTTSEGLAHMFDIWT